MTRNSMGCALGALAALACAVPALAQDYAPGPVNPPPASGAPGSATAPAPAPIEWDKKRLERLERNLRKLENELARLQPTKAPPQLVEPDPEVVALQGRVDDQAQHIQDLEAALKKVNAALEQATFDVETLKKDDAAGHADADALRARITDLEGQVKALAPPPPPPAGGPAPTGQAAPGDAAATPPAGDASEAFKAAMKTMRGGDYAGASKAFEDYLATWPDGADAPEAHYRLAETLYVRDDQANAAQEYARALKGSLKAPWSPDAMVKLGMSLQAQGRNAEACKAEAEFTRRFATTAPAAVKARASALKTKAKCAKA
jgi:tol-pal system protein YbgF